MLNLWMIMTNMLFKCNQIRCLFLKDISRLTCLPLLFMELGKIHILIYFHRNIINLLNNNFSRLQIHSNGNGFFISDRPRSDTLSQLWRRYVYDRKLYALPLTDLHGRFRECTAAYYR